MRDNYLCFLALQKLKAMRESGLKRFALDTEVMRERDLGYLALQYWKEMRERNLYSFAFEG